MMSLFLYHPLVYRNANNTFDCVTNFYLTFYRRKDALGGEANEWIEAKVQILQTSAYL